MNKVIVAVLLLLLIVSVALFAWYKVNEEPVTGPPTAPVPSTQPAPAEPAAPEPSAETPPAAESVPAEAAPEEQLAETQPEDTAKLRIQGIVLDAKTDAPIAGAKIYTAMAGNEMASATSGETGEYTLEMGLDEWMEMDSRFKSILCDAPAHAQGTKDLSSLPPGEAGMDLEERVDFFLQPGVSIAGRVTDAKTGAGIAGVAVRAGEAGISFMEQMQRMGRTSAAPEKTDEEGNYLLGNLSPGTYSVTLQPQSQGYLFASGDARTVSLAEGEQKTGVDFALSEGGVVHGTVTDAAGAPIAKARVVVMPADIMSLSMQGPERMMAYQDANTSTGEQGNYEIKGLELDTDLRVVGSAKEYAGAQSEAFQLTAANRDSRVDLAFTRGCKVSGIVRYEDETLAPETRLTLMPNIADIMAGKMQDAKNTRSDEQGNFEFTAVGAGKYTLNAAGDMAQFNPFAQDKDKIVEVEVDGVNDVTGLEFTIARSGKADVTPGNSKTLRGTVLDANGAPVKQVQVAAAATDDASQRATAQTQDDGSFVVSALKSDYYNLSVKSDRGNGTLERVAAASQVTLRLDPPTPVSGQVVDSSGAGVPGCDVRLASAADEGGMGSLAEFQARILGGNNGSIKTNEMGFFEFKNVDAGDYTLKAKSKTKGSANLDLKVYSGQAKTGLQVTLQPGLALGGRVMNGAGTPVEGATVVLTEKTGTESDLLSIMPGALQQKDYVASSDAQGNYRIDNVAPAVYALSASHTDYANTREDNLDLTASRDVLNHMVTLSEGGAAEGTILKDGAPRAGMMVQLVGGGGMKSATSDAQGYFKFEGITPGEYIAQAMDMSRVMSGDLSGTIGPKHVEILPGQTTLIDFSPAPGSVPVSGTVTGNIPKMTVLSVRSPGGPDPSALSPTDFQAGVEAAKYQVGTALIGQDGKFELPALAPGEYIVTVVGANDPGNMDEMMNMAQHPLIQQNITVTADQPLTLNLQLP